MGKYDDYRVDKLREELKQRGADSRGKKKTLIERQERDTYL